MVILLSLPAERTLITTELSDLIAGLGATGVNDLLWQRPGLQRQLRGIELSDRIAGLGTTGVSDLLWQRPGLQRQLRGIELSDRIAGLNSTRIGDLTIGLAPGMEPTQRVRLFLGMVQNVAIELGATVPQTPTFRPVKKIETKRRRLSAKFCGNPRGQIQSHCHWVLAYFHMAYTGLKRDGCRTTIFSAVDHPGIGQMGTMAIVSLAGSFCGRSYPVRL